MDEAHWRAPLQRARGRLELSCRSDRGITRLGRLFESGGQRWRFPARGGDRPLEAVQLNTAGGLAGGDQLDLGVDAGSGTRLTITTQAAERVYRSLGPATRITARLEVGAGATVSWLPQETLIYDRARMVRSTEVAIAGTSSLLLCDMLVFGRHASGERVVHGLLDDRWRVSIDGRLVLLEPFRLDGAIDDLLLRPAVAAGARAVASMIATKDIATLDSWRAAAEECGVRAGVGEVRGLVRARLLAATGGELKPALGRLLARLGRPAPRVWRC